MVPHKNEPLLNSGLKKHANYVHILMILSSVIHAFSWKMDMLWLRLSNLMSEKFTMAKKHIVKATTEYLHNSDKKLK